MNNLSRFSIACFTVISLSGCGTLFTDAANQEVIIDSHQKGISLYDHHKKYICDLPCTLNIDSSDIGIYVADGEGYKPRMISLGKEYNKASHANVFSIFQAVDSVSGARIVFDKKTMIELERE